MWVSFGYICISFVRLNCSWHRGRSFTKKVVAILFSCKLFHSEKFLDYISVWRLYKIQLKVWWRYFVNGVTSLNVFKKQRVIYILKVIRIRQFIHHCNVEIFYMSGIKILRSNDFLHCKMFKVKNFFLIDVLSHFVSHYFTSYGHIIILSTLSDKIWVWLN